MCIMNLNFLDGWALVQNHAVAATATTAAANGKMCALGRNFHAPCGIYIVNSRHY